MSALVEQDSGFLEVHRACVVRCFIALSRAAAILQSLFEKNAMLEGSSSILTYMLTETESYIKAV